MKIFSALLLLVASTSAYAETPEAKGTIGLICTNDAGEVLIWNGAKIPGVTTPPTQQNPAPSGFEDCLRKVIHSWQQQHSGNGNGGSNDADAGVSTHPHPSQNPAPIPTADELIGGYSILRGVIESAQLRR